MPMYNLIEHSHNYLKSSRILFQHCKDIPAVDNDVQLLILLKLMLMICLILK